ncbi:unnamed protein product [Malus baccata var. baccata]
MIFSSSTKQSVISRFFNNLWKKCAPCSSDHRRKPTDTDRDEAKWAFPEELCRRFSFAEIIAATQNFNKRLGRGDADVYIGYTNLNGVTSTVAIKRIPGAHFEIQQGREFKAEVQLLCQLRHPNVISLIGFCQDKVEYAINPLSWKQRLNICIGVARAIHYLHAGVKHVVIHRDVKCDNILLDQNLEAKLSNYRLSKMGLLTEKSDVFSFGVVLFEVLSASLRAIPRIYIARPADILDPFLMGKIAPDCLLKFLDIIQRCVRPTGAQRPTMGEVEVELELALELQERADAEKELRTTSTPLDQPADCAYGYEGISVSELNETFSPTRSADFSVLSDDDDSSEFEYSGR